MSSLSRIAELRPEDLPRPPEVALRILAACADPRSELGAIARLVAADPGLTADLLRIINSAYFGFDREIASIDLAVSLLGLTALRTRVLCVALHASASETDVPHMNLDEFLEDSVRRAVAARELAKHAAVNPDDAFAAGLLQDFGLLAMFHLSPDVSPDTWSEMRTALPDKRLALEDDTFDMRHDTVLGELGTIWYLPETLTAALVSHHLSTPHSGLGGILLASDWLNAVFTASDPRTALHHAESLLGDAFGMTVEDCYVLLSEIPGLVNEAAASLGVTVASRAEFDSLTRHINTQLADDNLSYQELTWQLQQALRERDALALERDREMDIAREIQCSLLPSDAASSGPVWARNVSARILSGDFYDFFERGDGCICFTLGDVSGKGLTAALLMAKTSSLFHCLGRRLTGLAKIMTVLNDELCESNVRGMFVTMIVGVFDPRTHALELVNAGHPPPLMRTGESEFVEIEASSLPLGIIPGTAYKSQTLSMRNASLYLYSDGVTEAVCDNGQELGLEGLRALLENASSLPPNARIEAIVNQVISPTGPLRDDLTLALLEPVDM